MIKKKVVKKFNQEKILLGVGFVIFLILAATAIYAFSFLGNNLLTAFSPGESGTSDLEFNLEEFDKLGL